MTFSRSDRAMSSRSAFRLAAPLPAWKSAASSRRGTGFPPLSLAKRSRAHSTAPDRAGFVSQFGQLAPWPSRISRVPLQDAAATAGLLVHEQFTYTSRSPFADKGVGVV